MTKHSSSNEPISGINPLRIAFWCIQAAWLSAAIFLGMGNAHAEAPSQQDLGQQQATLGQVADVGTTGAGLLMGAAEANPLGLVTLGIKAVAYQRIKNSPPTEQPRLWGIYGAAGWGAAANNLCVIATIATGGAGAVLCPLLGLGAGIGSWNAGSEERDRATFAAICDQAKAKNPDMVCVYNSSKG